MATTNERWMRMEAALRERAYAVIDNQPEVLLEGDGGPVGMKADVILARFLGFDDQIIQDGYRLQRVEPEWLMPIHPRMTARAQPDPPPMPMMRTARYVLQSGYVLHHLSGEYAPADVSVDLTTLQFSVLYLRYRRR